MNKKQIKNLKNEQKQLLDKLNISLDDALEQYKKYTEINALNSYIPNKWQEARYLLQKMYFIDENNNLTCSGKVASLMCDSYPLVRAIIITCNDFKTLSFNEIVAWLGIFAWTSNLEDNDDSSTPIDSVIEYTSYMMMEIYNKELIQPNLKVNIIYDWIINKNIVHISQYIGLEDLGNFIKTILRISSFIDELKTILLGLEMYDIYNKLENHEEKLFYGIVSNSSIYV